MAEITTIPPSLEKDEAVSNVSTQIIDTKFGRPEDIIEAHVYNLNNEIISSFTNIKDEEGITLDLDQADIISNPSNPPGTDLEPSNSNPQNSPPPQELFDTIEIDSLSFLSDKFGGVGFSFGTYNIEYNFLRPKILLNNDLSPADFNLKTISPSRTEIEIQNVRVHNQVLESAVGNYITDLNSYTFFRDFTVNFGNNRLFTGLNIALNKTDPNNYTIYIKLYEALPNTISIGNSLFICDKLTDSVSIETTLSSQFIPDPDISIPLRPPNFTLDITKNLSVPTDYKTYNDLLLSENSSSYRRLLNKMSSIKPAIEYEDYVSGSTTVSAFNNFVHFGSATERLKNFKYKVELYELYNNQLNSLSSSLSSNYYISANSEIVERKLDTLIENFDDYESYLFYESTSFAWPKTNRIIPYELAPATSSAVLTWIGSEIESDYYYGGRISSASLYDKLNPYNLLNTIPLHIRDNSENKQYEIFVQMIGQHFDQIWTYIDDIGEIKDADNSPNRGISRDLVYYALKSVGLDGFKADFDRTYIQDLLETSVTASNICDFVEDRTATDTRNINSVTGVKTSLNDYNKEIWKRLYHNVPYLLKTRGTERGLRALISCYGIPDTVLQVKEFGGPQKTGNLPNYYIHNKFSYAFAINEGVKHYAPSGSITDEYDGRIVHEEYSDNTGPRTIELRFKTPFKKNQIIWEKSRNISPGSMVGDYYNDGYALINYVVSDETTEASILDFTASLEHSASAAAGTYNGGLSQYYDYGRIVFSASNAAGMIVSGTLTPYAPIYDGDWWNLSFRIPTSGSSTTIKTDLKKAPDGLEKQYNNIIKHTASGEFDFSTITSGSGVLETFYYNSPVTIARTFNGALQEYREYNEFLDDGVLEGHTESPEMFDGNTYSSSFESLYLRLSLGFDLETTFFPSSLQGNVYIVDEYITSSYFEELYFYTASINMCRTEHGNTYFNGLLNSIHPNQSTKRYAEVSSSFLYVPNEENLYTRYPNSSANNLTSTKIRIENSTFDDPPILSMHVRGEEPAYETAPLDSSKLGVYFSPVYEMNKDITGELGLYDFDNYIGDPSDIDKKTYTALETVEEHYKKKKPTNLNRYKFEDYIRLVQFFDTSLFDAIEQFVPARVNLMKGLVIEPTLFDRNKIPTFYPSLQNLTHETLISSSVMDPGISSEYLLTTASYTLSDYFGNFEKIAPLYGNFVAKKPSIFYATVITNSTLVTVVPPDGGIGGIPPYEEAVGEASPETPGGPPGGGDGAPSGEVPGWGPS